MTWLLWVGAALGADCAVQETLAGLARRLGLAEDHYADLDAAGFQARLDEADASLSCVDGVIEPRLAAQYHRLQGLSLYTLRNERLAVLAFAGAHAADPTDHLPERLLPAGHDGRTLYETATTPGETEAVPAPAAGVLWFDGRPGSVRPIDRATLVQVLEAGTPIETAWLLPGDPMPPYEPVRGVDPVAGPDPDARSASKPRWALLGGGIAMGVASAALYGGASQGAARFAGPLPPEQGEQELDGLRRRTNALVIGSAVTGTAALAGFVGFTVVR